MLGPGAPRAQGHVSSQKGRFLPCQRLSCAPLALAMQTSQNFLSSGRTDAIFFFSQIPKQLKELLTRVFLEEKGAP